MKEIEVNNFNYTIGADEITNFRLDIDYDKVDPNKFVDKYSSCDVVVYVENGSWIILRDISVRKIEFEPCHFTVSGYPHGNFDVVDYPDWGKYKDDLVKELI